MKYLQLLYLIEETAVGPLNLRAPPQSLQLGKATASTSPVCTVCPSSVFILFIVFCTILYLLFAFICFFFLIYPCILPNFLPCSFLLYFCIYLFIPCPLTWPYTFPASYLFLLLSFSPSSISFFLLTLVYSYFFPLYFLSYFSFVDYLSSDTSWLSSCLFLPVHILQTYSLCCTAE